MTELGEFAMWMAIGGALVTTILAVVRPIGLALARRISGRTVDPATGLTTGEMTAERVAQLEERIADLEADRLQLEERLDFAERLLPRTSAEPNPLGPGGA